MSMPEILPPEILTAAEAAWGRAQEGQVHTGKNIGSAAIFGALDGAVRKAREESEIGFGALEVIANPEIKELFKRDFEDYKAIFAGAGIDMPTPAEFAQGGIDFRHLAELKEQLPDYDLVVTPLTLPLRIMRQFISVASESLPNIMPAAHGNRSSTSFIDKIIVDNWNTVMETTIAGWKFPTVGKDRWTAFMLLNDNIPKSQGLAYNQIAQDEAMVPLVGYTAYQMHRIHRGILPVSRYGLSSWAAGKFTYRNETCIPFAGWGRGQLFVGYRELSEEGGEEIGVRSLRG